MLNCNNGQHHIQAPTWYIPHVYTLGVFTTTNFFQGFKEFLWWAMIMNHSSKRMSSTSSSSSFWHTHTFHCHWYFLSYCSPWLFQAEQLQLPKISGFFMMTPERRSCWNNRTNVQSPCDCIHNKLKNNDKIKKIFPLFLWNSCLASTLRILLKQKICYVPQIQGAKSVLCFICEFNWIRNYRNTTFTLVFL